MCIFLDLLYACRPDGERYSGDWFEGERAGHGVWTGPTGDDYQVSRAYTHPCMHMCARALSLLSVDAPSLSPHTHTSSLSLSFSDSSARAFWCTHTLVHAHILSLDLFHKVFSPCVYLFSRAHDSPSLPLTLFLSPPLCLPPSLCLHYPSLSHVHTTLLSFCLCLSLPLPVSMS